VRGEDGELLADIDGAAFGAIGLLTVPDELLEVRLALHADVLVDRHDQDSKHPPRNGLRPMRRGTAFAGSATAVAWRRKRREQPGRAPAKPALVLHTVAESRETFGRAEPGEE
jgi:hypothetical protein